jgi:hypothetical protein
MAYSYLSQEYRFSRETNMALSDKAELFSRLHELRSQQGKGWKEIANILEKEGYEENGKALTDNALRKRYTKWNTTETRGTSPVASDRESKQETQGSDFDRLQKSRMDSALKQFGRGGSVPAGSPEDAIASLMTLNNQLLSQVQESNRLMQRLEKRIEQQELKSSHTGIDTEDQPVTSRDLLELLKELTSRRDQMIHIEEQKRNYIEREEVQQLLEELIPDKVDAELRTMLQGQPVRNLISGILDDMLNGYMQDITVKEAHRGPGRGKLGRTHKKFSASLPEDLFAEVKSLPGMFSSHLDASLRLYLKMLKGSEQ